MDKFSYAKIYELPDIQRAYNFQVDFSEAANNTSERLSEFINDITLRCHSATIPERGNESIELGFGALKTFYTGRPTFGNNQSTLVFAEHEDLKVSELLNALHIETFDIVNHRGGSNRLKVNIKLYDNAGVHIGTYTLFNAYLESHSTVNLSHSSDSTGLRFSAVFRYDYHEYNPTNSN